MLDNAPCVIIENEFVKPGKGQAFNRVKLRNLKTNRVLEKTFKSGESVPAADVEEVTMLVIFQAQDHWQLMNQESFDQIEIPLDQLGDAQWWLKEQDECTVTLFNGSPITIQPPNFVALKIAQTDPGLKGDTSGGGSKPATLETGAVVKVPLFVQEGECIRVDTRTGTYMARASAKDET